MRRPVAVLMLVLLLDSLIRVPLSIAAENPARRSRIAATAVNQAPVAAFTVAPASPVSGQPVTFTNGSTDADGDPMQYWWTFGDGQTSSDGKATIAYAAPGTYTVELLATDNQHPWVSVSRTVVVGQPAQISAPVVSVISATTSRPAGATATATFSVRNDNAAARSYALAATSSNPAIVPDPADPATISVPAASTATVTVNYQVSASAASGSTSVVTLRATDAGDATKTHSATFTHTTQAAPANQAPAARFTYAPSSPVSGQPVTFTNTSTDPEGDPLQYWWTFGDGQTSSDGNVSITYAAAGTYTVQLSATDNRHPSVLFSQTIVVGQPAQISAPVVTLIASTSSSPAGSTMTARFSVRNPNAALRRYAFQVTSGNLATVADPADPALLDVAAGATVEIPITYTVLASAAPGSTSLIRFAAADALDNSKWSAATFTHTTAAAVTIVAPGVEVLSYPASLPPGSSGAGVFRVTNRSSVARGYTFRGISAHPNVVPDPADPAPIGSIAAGASADVTVTYQIPANATVGSTAAIQLEANDSQDPSKTNYATFYHTTSAPAVLAPVVQAASASLSRPAGATAQATFSVRNDNASQRTYSFVATSSNTAVVGDPADPAPLAVPANSTASMTVTYPISTSAAAGSTATVTLRATDTADTAKTHAAAFTHTTEAPALLAPQVGIIASPSSATAGSTATARFSVRNPNASRRTYAFQATASDLAVVADPADPATIGIDGGATIEVPLSYTVAGSAAVGSTSVIKLAAADAVDNSKWQAAWFVHTTAVPPDTTAPAIGFNRATNTTVTDPNFQLTIDITDARDVVLGATVISLNQADVTASFAPALVTPDHVRAAQIVQLAQGLNRIVVQAADASGNRAQSELLVTYQLPPDTTAPLIEPNHALVTTQATAGFQLTVDVRDNREIASDGVRISFNGTDVTSVVTPTRTPPSWVQWAFLFQLEAGVNTFRITARDVAGNTSESVLQVTYDTGRDTTAPVIEFNRDPNTTQPRPGFQLTVDVRDDREVVPGALRVYFNGVDVTGVVAPTYAPPAWVQWASTFQLEPGVNTFRVTANDAAGNPTEGRLQVTYATNSDTVAPAIQFEQASGTTQSTPSFPVTINLRDDHAIDPATLRVFFNGSDVTDVVQATFTAPSWVQWAFILQLSPGANTIRTTIADTAGNASEATLAVTYSTGAPPPGSGSSKFTAYSIYASNIGNSFGIPIQFGGLDARQDRQWIHWTGCAPAYFANGDPDLGYDVAAVHAFAAANRGRHYIYLDEPAHGTPGNHRTSYTTPGCTQVTPAQYARAYKRFVDDLRAVDPTARVSPGGFEQVVATVDSYPRVFVDYATEFYDSYVAQFGAPPVTEWRFHLYWENGAWADPSDVTGWQAKTERAIAFGRQHGAPLVIAIGYPWNLDYDARMLTGMERMFAFLNANASVSSVFWWSYDFYQDGTNRLTTFNNEPTTLRTLTSLGERYRDLIAGTSAPPTPAVPVSVTPDGGSASAASSGSGTQTFTVTNVGTTAATYTLSRVCSGALISCGAPSATQVGLTPGQSVAVTVSWTAGASGSGVLTLTATQAGASSSDSGSYTITVAGAPGTFDLTPHNGENVNVSQFGGNLSYTTPAYVTMDQDRAVTLFYSSGQADPRGLVQVDVTDTTPQQAYSILLRTESGAPITLTNGTSENFYAGGTGGVTRLAAQFDPAQFHGGVLPAGARAYRVQVVVRRWNGGVAADSQPQWAQVLIVNERESPYGRGWSIEGLARIHLQSDQSVILTGGDGSALYYAPAAGCAQSCTYRKPAGEWSELQFTGTEFIRTYPGGGRDIFNASGSLIAAEDRAGNRTEFAYDGERLRRITDPTAAFIQFNYAQRLASIVDLNSRTTRLTHDAEGKLTSMSLEESPAAAVQELGQLTYDSRSRLQSWTDRGGAAWSYDYDRAGKLAGTTTPPVVADGQTKTLRTTFTSLAAAVLPPAETGASLASLAPNLPAANVEVSSTDARGATTWTALDRFGAQIRLRDALQRTAQTERDGESRVRRTVSITGHSIRYDWDGPRIRNATDETLGTAVHYDYEPDGWRRVLRVSGDVAETLYEYETGPHKTNPGLGTDTVKVRRSPADTTFAITKYTYDVRGMLASVTDPEGHGSFFSYDAGFERPWNLLTEQTGAASSQYRSGVRYVRDAYGRVRETYSQKWAGEPFPQLQETLEGAVDYDAWNRVRVATDSAGRRTTYSYAGERGLHQVTDAKQQVYTYDRNALGWTETEVDPRGKIQRFAYDAAGNVLTATNRRNQTIAFAYDLLGRMQYRDADGARTTWTYHPDNLHVTVSNLDSTDEIVTDVAGRPDRQRIQRGSLAIVLDETVNTLGQREELAITGPFAPRSIGYSYDERHRFSKLRDFNGNYAVVGRDDDGMARQTFPNPRFGILHEITSSHRAASNNYTGIGGTDSDHYVGLGNPGAGFRQDERGRLQARYPASTPTRYWKYRYDDVTNALQAAEEWDRPTETCYHDPDRGYYCEAEADFANPNPDPLLRARRTISYGRDAVGNPTSGAVVDTGNRLTSYQGYTMTYDDDGNMTTKRNAAGTFNQSLVWNSLSQLVSVTTNAVTITYGYDGLGRRVRRGTDTQFIYDNDDLLMELSSGAIAREYAHYPGTDRPHSMRDWTNGANGATYYYALQEPGHVVGLINTDGIVVNEYRYEPFGMPAAGYPNEAVSNPLRFAAREWDGSSQLYYMRNRWYDPALERFASEDPIGLEGGINPYVYAANSPMTFTDPMGLTAQVSDECSFEAAQMNKCALGLLGLVVRGIGSTVYIDVDGGMFGRSSALRGVGGPEMGVRGGGGGGTSPADVVKCMGNDLQTAGAWVADNWKGAVAAAGAATSVLAGGGQLLKGVRYRAELAIAEREFIKAGTRVWRNGAFRIATRPIVNQAARAGFAEAATQASAGFTLELLGAAAPVVGAAVVVGVGVWAISCAVRH